MDSTINLDLRCFRETQPRLVSQRKLPWQLTKRFRYLSFWNGNLGVCLFSGLNNSEFSQNRLPGIPPCTSTASFWSKMKLEKLILWPWGQKWFSFLNGFGLRNIPMPHSSSLHRKPCKSPKRFENSWNIISDIEKSWIDIKKIKNSLGFCQHFKV